MRIKNKLLFATTLWILLLALLFAGISWSKERKSLLREVDEKLRLAAALASESIPVDYHDRITDAASVAPEEFRQMVTHNNQLCQQLGLQYLWSCMMVDGNLVFTSSTSPSKKVENHDFPAFFSINPHREPYTKALQTKFPVYTTFREYWGERRMLVVPSFDRYGRPIFFGASVSLSIVNRSLEKIFNRTLALSGMILAAGVLGGILLSTTLARPISKLAKTAKLMAGGDMSQNPAIGGGAELSSIGKSLETMRDSLQDTISRLEAEVAEHKQTEAGLRRSQEKYRSLVDNLRVGIALISPEMRVLSLNAHMQSCNPDRDFSHQPLCYESFNDPPRSEVCSYCPAFRSFQDGQVHEVITETPYYGKIRNYRLQASPVKNEKGEVVAVIEIAEDFTERKRLEREILQISEAEKQRLGRDLHDGICQALMGTALQTTVISRRLAQANHPESLKVAEISKRLEETSAEVRDLARNLFPSGLASKGFLASLKDLATYIERTFQIPCSLECPVDPVIADENLAAHLFRIAQECLHNAARHSHASTLQIRIEVDERSICLSVRDDGHGDWDPQADSDGMGMRTMRYRANQIGATLTISPIPGEGTKVICSAPRPAKVQPH
jgi:PAS domain-containing protein/two-component sensor histidine kinase